ncbi:helix-turn-helix transcriptional regulator [uncultured Corynebacterium sp.]|uniref:helix-turn-helix domain-containing protein n=1 Tax=uncultured Corynebacterium sp. TaxID=159447 RepID=UPI0028D7C91D|nr:helix-turn-helix transcriptional regulator [uncultured Corynebacterium sp.]
MIVITADPGERPLMREAIGEVFRTIRHHRSERISDVARRANVSPQYLSEVERGVKDPSSEIVESISTALDLPVSDVLRQAARRIDPPQVCIFLPIAA